VSRPVKGPETSNGGIRFTGVLLILFIGLRLTGFIDWSWWWVLSPAWIPLVFVAGVLSMCAAFVAGAEFVALAFWAWDKFLAWNHERRAR